MNNTRTMKKLRVKATWQYTVSNSTPVPYLKRRVAELMKLINRLSLETSIFQHFVDVNQLDDELDSNTSLPDWSNEHTGPPSAEMVAGILRKRAKQSTLSLDHKFSIAHQYLRSMIEVYETRKRQADIYYTELIAENENNELKGKTIQNELNCLVSKLGPDLCFPNKKHKDLRFSSEKWKTNAVVPNDTIRDGQVRATKLENVSLLHEIRNVEIISKYEEKVDITEFLRKMLEKCSFPIEIERIARKRGKIQFHVDDVERKMYNLRRLLEKEMAHGEELRGRIAHERKMLDHAQQSLAMSITITDKETNTDQKLGKLLDTVRGPQVPDYIKINQQNMELRDIVKMWQLKVSAAKLVKDMNQQKWARLQRMFAIMR